MAIWPLIHVHAMPRQIQVYDAIGYKRRGTPEQGWGSVNETKDCIESPVVTTQGIDVPGSAP